ncbi:uncharacterized protein LOC141903097 isoform X2 [Tubulanus polymorphus]|uniref:uncharacterized protein LOC141903097 isoform X2 n=1 Tax=Tubulanus polymorphus TaxID=672921 RepID=UPI003DA564FB
MSGCQRFKENAWRRELCGDCLRPRGEHGAPPTGQNGTNNGAEAASDGNIVFSGSSTKTKDKKSSPLKTGPASVKPGSTTKPGVASGKPGVASGKPGVATGKPGAQKLSGVQHSSPPGGKHRSNNREKPALPAKGAHLKNLKIDQSPPRNRTRTNSTDKNTVAIATLPKQSALRRKPRILGKLCSVKFGEMEPKIIGSDGGLNGSSSEEEEEESDEDVVTVTNNKLTPAEKEIAQITFDNTKYNSNSENLLHETPTKKRLEKLGSSEILAIEDDMLWNPKSFSSINNRKSPPIGGATKHVLDDTSSLSLSETNNECEEETNSDHDTVSSTETSASIHFSKKLPSLSSHRFKKQSSIEGDTGGIYHEYDISVRDRSTEREVTTTTDTTMTNLTRAYKVVDITPVKKVLPYKVIDIAENVPVSSPEDSIPPKLPTSTPPTSESSSSRQGSVTPRGATPVTTRGATPDKSTNKDSKLETPKNASFLHGVSETKGGATSAADVEAALKILKPVNQNTATPTGTITRSATVERRPRTGSRTGESGAVLEIKRSSYGKSDDSPLLTGDISNPVILYAEQEKLRQECASPRKVPIMIRHHMYEDIDSDTEHKGAQSRQENFYDLYDAVTSQQSTTATPTMVTPATVTASTVTGGHSLTLGRVSNNRNSTLAIKSQSTTIDCKRMTIASSLDLARTTKQIKRPAPAPPPPPVTPSIVPTPPPTSTLPRHSKKDSSPPSGGVSNQTEPNETEIKSKSRLSGKSFLKKFLKRGGNKEKQEYNFDMIGTSQEVAGYELEEDDDDFSSDSEEETVEPNDNDDEESVVVARQQDVDSKITQNKERRNQKEAKTSSSSSNPIKKRASFTKDDISGPKPIEQIKSIPGLINAGPDQTGAEKQRPRSYTEDETTVDSENKQPVRTAIRKPPAPPPPIPTHNNQQCVVVTMATTSSSTAFTAASKRARPPPPPAHNRPFSTLDGANRAPPSRPPPPTRISSVDGSGRSLTLTKRRESAPSAPVTESNNHTYETLPDETSVTADTAERRLASRIYEPVILPRDTAADTAVDTLTAGGVAYELIDGDIEKPSSNQRNSMEGYLTPFKTVPRQYYNTNSLNRSRQTDNPGLDECDNPGLEDKPKNDQLLSVENSENISSSWENLFAVLDVGGPSGSRKISLPTNTIDPPPETCNDIATITGRSATLPHRQPPPRSESLRETRVESLRNTSSGSESSSSGVSIRRDSFGESRRRRNRDSLPEQYVLIYRQQPINKTHSNGVVSRSNSIDSTSDDSEYMDMSHGRRGHRLPEGVSITDVQTTHECVSRMNLDTLRNMFHDWLKNYSNNQVIDTGKNVGWGNFVLHASDNIVNTANAIYYSAHLRDNDSIRCTLRVSRQPICSEMDEISHPSVVIATQRFNSVIPSQFVPSDIAVVTEVVSRAYITVLPFEQGFTASPRHQGALPL